MELFRVFTLSKNIKNPTIFRISSILVRRYSQKKGVDELDEPIKFSESPAASWRARDSRIGVRTEMPWFQPYVISLSVGIFLIYFCVLREENDIDKELSKTLYDRIEGLEEFQIKKRIEYNLEHNLDIRDLEARLRELEAMKKR